MGIRHLPEIAELAAAGKRRPTIGEESPFADAISVITNVEAGRRAPGRVVLAI
jgi:NADPH:quinone reductase-like Zn-dependent oxidoreductase